MSRIRFMLLLCLMTFNGFKIHASDCLLYEVSLSQIINKSSLIVEGKVISSSSEWNNDRTGIYTKNIVKISSIFKGAAPGTTITVITEGGQVNDQYHYATNTLHLMPDQVGMFFLIPAASSFGKSCYKAYADQQGFYAYDLETETAFGTFDNFKKYKNSLYHELIETGGLRQHIIAPLTKSIPSNSGAVKVSVIPTISSFSPGTISAGTKEVLTINGTGFGATRGNGTVEFKRANDEGVTAVRPLNSDFISWSDNQIQVMVPSQAVNAALQLAGPAGSGTIKVINNTLESVVSTTPLIVEYSVFNSVPTTLNSPTFNLSLTNANASGGYTFNMNNDFAANAPAVASFTRAFNNWICNSSVNWQIGTNSAVSQHLNDGINIITFDNNDLLGPGVGGRGDLFFTFCTSGTTTRVGINDCDIRFSATAGGHAWNFGPGNPVAGQVDFESVAVHELGHLLGIDHTLEAAVMFPKLSTGVTRRVLDIEDTHAGTFAMNNAVIPAICGVASMIPFSQPTLTASISTSATTICSGSSITATATVNGNVGSPVFTWKKNGVTFGTNNATQTISGLTNGQVITCVVTDAAICSRTISSNQVTITVNPLPAPPVITTPVSCITNGAAVTYTASALTGNPVYIWTFPSGVTFTGPNNTQTVTVTYPAAFKTGTIGLSGTSNGCSSATSSQYFVASTPNTPGTISGPSNGLCLTFNQLYSVATVINATSYVWSAPVGATIQTPSTTNSQAIHFGNTFSSGNITVRAANGTCLSAVRSKTVSGTPSQPGTISGTFSGMVAPVGKTYTIAAVPTATSYNWTVTGGGALITSGQNTTSCTMLFTSNGNKNICVTASNSCGASPQRCRTAVVGIGLREQDDFTSNEYSVFPNPFTNQLNVAINSSQNENLLVTVIDLAGRILEQKNMLTENGMVTFETGALKNGFYFIQITGVNVSKVIKVIKE